ncbi:MULTISPECIES: WbuC family cupin fold metalloprotein [Pseudomonas]|uniref:WbuC family cupin fold metalloprotein n=1 Tax=Pseudomonas TaxID=286 RepID=UPI00070CC9E1|nr:MULTISPECIES: WbuC family cupin fold metalloprotein [Pseudomonas]KQW15066.1 cupin [Pseudomonas sp. Root401]WHS52747.1 WbuC family cupin fold metalloprotein [Pseudomonas brassicacearum]
MTRPSFLDHALFDELAEKAAASPRGRQHHNFHGMDEPCHRMAVGLQPSTYIPPHRHLSADKAETLLVLKGRLGVLIFDEAGAVVDKRILQAGGDSLGVDLPAGVYHGLVVLEADSLMFECKAGPYRPVGEGELAHWAPREGEAGVAQYHAWMRAQFD